MLSYISEKQVNYAMIVYANSQRLGGERQNENEVKVIEFWTIYFPSSKITLRFLLNVAEWIFFWFLYPTEMTAKEKSIKNIQEQREWERRQH